jgi:L-erythro-3,5-diaminohexanoate dehydrogenase
MQPRLAKSGLKVVQQEDMAPFKPADPLGIQRVTQPKGKGILPLQAESLDSSLPIAEDELLIEVESLSVDSASFHQISQECGGDPARIEKHIVELVARRGKLQNPVLGSGGMLVGRVAQIGPAYPLSEKPVKVGDRIATLVSLALTPLHIRAVRQIHPKKDRLDIEGHAILFASGVFAHIPDDIPETVALAVLDAAGVPAQTSELIQDNQTVVVIGAGGKSGLLCLYEAKQKDGVKVIAVDMAKDAIDRLTHLQWVDDVIEADARDAVGLMEKVWNATKGKMADVVIDLANVPDTEMACILCVRSKGIVYSFNSATSFNRAAQGAQGVGADIELRIGNGYAPGHAELTLNVLRESEELARIFTEMYS